MTTTFTGMVRIPGSIENGLPSTITLDPHMLVLTAGGTELGRWNRSELKLRREPDGSFHLTLGREVVLFNPDSPLEFAILSGMPGAGTAPAPVPAAPPAAPAAPPAVPAAPPATPIEPPMTTPPAPAPVAPVAPMQASHGAPPTPAPAAAEYSAPPSAPAAPFLPPPATPPVEPVAPPQASPAAPPPSPSMPPPAAMPPQPAAAPVAPSAVDPMTSPVAPAPSTPMAASPPLPPQAPSPAPPATPAPEPMTQPQPMTSPVAPAAGMDPAGAGLAAPPPAAAAPVAFELEQQQELAEPEPVAAEPAAPRSSNFWDAFYADESGAQMAPADGLVATAIDDDAPAIPGFHLEDNDPEEEAETRAPRLGGYGSGLFTEEDDAPAFAPAFTAGDDDEPDERTWSFYDEDEERAEERSWSYDDESVRSNAAVEDREPPELPAAADDREDLVAAPDGSRLGAILGAAKGWRPSVPSLSFGSSGLGMRAREAVSVLDAILEENGTEDIPRSFILGLGGFAALLALVAVLVVLFG